MNVFHTIGVGQYFGTVKFHLFEDCQHLTRKRTQAGWDRTGLTHEGEYDVEPYQICKLCQRRKKDAAK